MEVLNNKVTGLLIPHPSGMAAKWTMQWQWSLLLGASLGVGAEIFYTA